MATTSCGSMTRPARARVISCCFALLLLLVSLGCSRRTAHVPSAPGVFPPESPSSAFTEAFEAQQFYAAKRIPVGETAIPVERYGAAIEKMRFMPQFSTPVMTEAAPKAYISKNAAAFLGSWTALGPGNVGGRTRALLVNPVTPATMYTAGVAGGIWKSTNSGASWTPVADTMANLAVNSMVIDPTNPNVIYAGTGEGYFNFDAVRGAGIFKTTDGGSTWNRLSSTNNSDFYYVNDIVISPDNSQRVYAATRTGVWRSTDGGNIWTRVLNPAVTLGCLDLAIRTDQPTDYLFASCGGTSNQAIIYRNRDAAGAGAWTAVQSGSFMGRTSLAIAPSNQSIVYALASSIDTGSTYNDGLYAVFRSSSGGDSGTWTAQVTNANATKLNRVLLTNPVYAFFSTCGFGSDAYYNQGWYDNVIAVDPADPDRVWVGGIDLFRSDDAGLNWGLASYWWASTSSPPFAHADQHALVFHPQYNGTTNRTMFVANDGGIFRTDDARAPVATTRIAPCNPANTSVSWTQLNNNYGVTQFYHGVPYPGGATYFGGTQDNGTVRGTTATGLNWSSIMGGDGGYVAVNPVNTNILYAENTRFSIQKSTDGGSNFAGATSGISDSGAMFIVPFIMDPTSASRLWTGGTYMWRTTNSAGSWTKASTALAGSVSAIAVANANPDHILAGTRGGVIHRTTSGLTATSSTAWPSTQPRAGYVSWLTFDPTNENIGYATYSTFGGTHVWKSTDGGATWAGIDGSGATAIPDIPVHSIVVDRANTARLYIGTDLGVFSSQDGGATWAVEVTGFANVVTEALGMTIANGVQNVYAFTHGRGVWRASIGTTLFADVPRGYWTYDHITGIFNAAITNGCGGGYYCPDDTVTREQMAAFLIRALEGERSASYCNSGSLFTDVPASSIQCGNIKRLSERGITAVVGTFNPQGLVTRGQMAAFIIRSLYGETFSYTAAPYFTDVPANHVFFKYAQKMKDTGLTQVSTVYFVDRNVTRAEMAAFMARAFLGMP